MTEPTKPGSKTPEPGRPGALVVRPGYDVGFGKPPEDSRFRKGVSGNPKGRPKGGEEQDPGAQRRANESDYP
ncbi:MAG: hypothetical protein EOP84_04475 [Verrucomicrobiaceae bacterium]|nr:MAG: hypothetical protein EOP84_04475 [Verrucomicrobiaceae bacterium]